MYKIYERCPNCLQYYTGAGQPCLRCGFDVANYECKSYYLEPMTTLQGKYMLGHVMETDMFGITYLGWDMNLATYVNIKEYFPENVAYRDLQANPGYTQVSPLPEKQEVYQEGLRIYAEEARNLSKFYDMQGISSVKNLFYDNGTAYVVREYDGPVIENREQYVDEPLQEKKPAGKKLPIIIVSVIAALVLVVALIMAIMPKDEGEDLTTEASTSQSTDAVTEDTTATTTEATTEVQPDFAGTWTDFKFLIDETEYELPMAYSVWSSYGWKTDVPAMSLNSGEICTIKCYNEDIECSVYITNYTEKDAPIEDCYVTGIVFFGDVHSVSENVPIVLPSDIKIYTKSATRSSVIEDVYDAYGEPDNETKNEYVTQYQYLDDKFNRLVLRGDGNGGIYRMMYVCMETPDGAKIQGGSRVEVSPLNNDYVSPTATTDRFDDIFNIDGVNYKLGVPVSQFEANGWTLECEKTELEPNHVKEAKLIKGDSSIEVTLSNTSIFYIDVSQAQIYDIRFTTEGMNGMDVTFPGGLKLGMTAGSFVELYGDMPNFFDTERNGNRELTVYNFVYTGQIAMEAIAVPSDDVEIYIIDEFYYENVIDGTDADYANVDYMQGVILQ